MDVKGNSSICGQCHKEVSTDNLALHESHCRRFLCVCPDCNETIPKEQLEQHRLEEHTQVTCSGCSQQMESRFLTDHKLQQCAARLLCCVFCEVELPCREMDQHQLVCGSRTERCSVCRRYILLRDLQQHGHSCPAAAAPPALHPPPQSTVTTPGQRDAKEKEKHMEEEEEEEEEEGVSAVMVPQVPQVEEEEDTERVQPCSFCQLLLPQVTLRWHEPKCKIHLSMK